MSILYMGTQKVVYSLAQLFIKSKKYICIYTCTDNFFSALLICIKMLQTTRTLFKNLCTQIKRKNMKTFFY